MSNLNESISLNVTEEMAERAEESGYPNKSEYARTMWLAGESAVAELDPRVGHATDANVQIDSPESAAKALDEGALLKQLSNEKQEFGDIVQTLTQEFENVLADRLHELATDDQSAVTTDGRGNYYIEE